ncbi:MAG: TetR/AcrR family transcriptional regulator [Oscillospiraceae bacterium]|nr:TetR/AcrR family transcriptional regulator [Oscillospiraceae bacterium]
MARKNEAHDVVVESLTQALLQLMEKKPLVQINVSELCSRAGVGRVSFYRNYDSMEEILVHYLKKCTDDWWIEFFKKPKNEFYATFWPELLAEYRKNENLIKLLYQNNASHLIKEHIFACCMSDAAGTEEDAYTRAALAGALYGMVDEWIKRGMGQFPENFSLRSIVRLMP